MAHGRARRSVGGSVGRWVGRSLTSCIGENGTHNHLPHAKAFGNYQSRQKNSLSHPQVSSDLQIDLKHIQYYSEDI